MEYDIKELDCSKMLINPNHPQLVNFMERNIPELVSYKIQTFKGFTRAMVYRYILLMYDPESPIQKMHALDHFKKKFEACAYAGFELKKQRDGHYRFHERVLDFILGKEDAINDMIVAFRAYTNNAKWDYIVFLKESMLVFLRDALGRKNTDEKASKDSKEYRALYDDYNKISNELVHSFEETEEFVSRFYYKIEQSRLAIRPEDYAKALSNGDDLRGDNPYGVGYAVDRIKFMGDKV